MLVTIRESSQWLPAEIPLSVSSASVQSLVARMESSEWLPGGSLDFGCQKVFQALAAKRESSHWFSGGSPLINRPGVAGAVLQSTPNLQDIINHKP